MDLSSFIKETEGLEKSLDFAGRVGLLPEKSPRDCLKCGRKNGLRWTKNSRVVILPYMFVCAQRECRLTIAIGRNTIFDHLTFPLSNALRLIYFWLLKMSVKDSANQLELTEMTVRDWYQYFREVCACVLINYADAIGGPGETVEFCEYQLPKDKSKDIWFITGVNRNTGENFVIHVEDLDCDTLWPIVKTYILPGSKVVTHRFREFSKFEEDADCPSLSFVHPNKCPRKEGQLDLDEMLDKMKNYVERETPADQLVCKELYAYEYLYFNMDNFVTKPASERILPFINDIKVVYPGFGRRYYFEHTTKAYKSGK